MLFDGLFDFGSSLLDGIGNRLGGLFGKSNGSPLEGIFNPSGWWDKFKNGKTNEVNREIAEANLQYQRERNAIEDARYEEETAYNRAFAEDERDYQRRFAEENRDYERALQQQIFEREDTAIERQASQLSKLGINPLSQNMSGLGSGAVVSQSMPGSSAPGAMSSRGGTALHNDFQMQDSGLLGLASPLMSLINGFDNINTNGVQRDALAEQRDGQILENQAKAIDNLIKADKNDININDDGSVSLRRSFSNKEQDFNRVEFTDKNATSERNERENKFQKDYGVSDKTPSPIRIATEIEKRANEPNKFEEKRSGQVLDLYKKSLLDPLFTVGKAIGSTAESAVGLFRNLINKKKNQSKKNKGYDDSYERAIRDQLESAGW